MSVFWSGLALGLAGSVHCAAMCGPLVAAVRRGVFLRVPSAGGRWHWRPDIFLGALYQGGRLMTYVGLGALAGRAGSMLVWRGFGRALAVVAGMALVLGALAVLRGGIGPVGRGVGRLVGRGVSLLRLRRADHPILVAAGLGALNGLLPCGLVYAALIAAVATGQPATASTLMLAFGIGTLPAMLGLWMASGAIGAGRRRFARLVAPAAVVLAGLLLIGRGIVGDAHPGATSASDHMHGRHP